MCGIYGSLTPEGLYSLHMANRSRGSEGCGYLHISSEGYAIQKFKDKPEFLLHMFSTRYNLGHNRAPTTNETGRGILGTHPFCYGRAIAAHNGILINTLELEENWKNTFPVDSQWIPFLYDKYYKEFKDGFKTFKFTLEHLSGTYGIWLYDVEEKTIFVARGDNSIFWNDALDSFSSVETPECKNLMPEGAIYESTDLQTFKDKNENDRLKRQKKYFIL